MCVFGACARTLRQSLVHVHVHVPETESLVVCYVVASLGDVALLRETRGEVEHVAGGLGAVKLLHGGVGALTTTRMIRGVLGLCGYKGY